jgi:hypothetical protein
LLAAAQDFPWWKSEPPLGSGFGFLEHLKALEDERRQCVERILGAEAAQTDTTEPLLRHMALTGAVLGGLPLARYNAVQVICQQSMERLQNYRLSRYGENLAPNAVDEAKLREQTRTDLRQVLSAEEMEEFLEPV